MASTAQPMEMGAVGMAVMMAAPLPPRTGTRASPSLGGKKGSSKARNLRALNPKPQTLRALNLKA